MGWPKQMRCVYCGERLNPHPCNGCGKFLTVETKSAHAWSADDILCNCPLCGAHAVVELTEDLKRDQPDGTTHVCHPGFGGCNHGFLLDG